MPAADSNQASRSPALRFLTMSRNACARFSAVAISGCSFVTACTHCCSAALRSSVGLASQKATSRKPGSLRLAQRSLGYLRSPRLQEFLDTTKLAGVSLFPQFPPEPSRVVTTFGPSVFQILSIRFQSRCGVAWVPVREIRWPEESDAPSFARGRTPVQWRAESDRADMRL